MTNPDIFAVEFLDRGELRMGSPYNVYSVDFTGRWQPDLKAHNLPKQGWTNLHAVSDDGRYHALIIWNLERNTPGFHVVYFDTHNQVIEISERHTGLPDSLQVWPFGFKVVITLIVKPQ